VIPVADESEGGSFLRRLYPIGQQSGTAEGSKRRGAGPPDKMLSVTVSIGAAGRSESAPTPHHVIKAADEALYRAKKAGRNRVSK